MRMLSKYQRKSPRSREAGASLVEYLLLICLISLGATASIKFFTKSVENKGYTMACTLSVQGGGTQGVIDGGEREGGGFAVVPPSDEESDETLSAFEARAIAACVQGHIQGEQETTVGGGRGN